MAIKIDGRKIQNDIKKKLIQKIDGFSVRPTIAIIFVGSDKGSEQYIRMKKKFGEMIGIRVDIFHFFESTDEKIIKVVEGVSRTHTGVMIQLPLPDNIDTKKVLQAIPQEKDVDVLQKPKHVFSDTVLYSPVATAFEYVLKEVGVDLNTCKKKIALVGFGKTVGAPIFYLLQNKGVKPIVIQKDTSLKDRYNILRSSDIIVSGVGTHGVVNEDMISDGSICIDVGFSLDEKGQTVGDFTFEAYEKSSFFSPVPGGVGPVGIVALFENLCKLHEIFSESR